MWSVRHSPAARQSSPLTSPAPLASWVLTIPATFPSATHKPWLTCSRGPNKTPDSTRAFSQLFVPNAKSSTHALRRLPGVPSSRNCTSYPIEVRARHSHYRSQQSQRYQFALNIFQFPNFQSPSRWYWQCPCNYPSPNVIIFRSASPPSIDSIASLIFSSGYRFVINSSSFNFPSW